MHPPQGDADIRILPVDHPVTRGLDDFVLVDERYSYLRVSPDAEVLATHVHDDLEHPVVWAHQRQTSRVVYDGLGHDAQSYDCEDHREPRAERRRLAARRDGIARTSASEESDDRQARHKSPAAFIRSTPMGPGLNATSHRNPSGSEKYPE